MYWKGSRESVSSWRTSLPASTTSGSRISPYLQVQAQSHKRISPMANRNYCAFTKHRSTCDQWPLRLFITWAMESWLVLEFQNRSTTCRYYTYSGHHNKHRTSIFFFDRALPSYFQSSIGLYVCMYMYICRSVSSPSFWEAHFQTYQILLLTEFYFNKREEIVTRSKTNGRTYRSQTISESKGTRLFRSCWSTIDFF